MGATSIASAPGLTDASRTASPRGDGSSYALIEAVRAAALLGWLSVVAVLVGIAVGLPVRHESVVLVTTALGAAGHAALGLLPWARILPTRRGRLLLDLWSVALLGGVAGLVVTAGGASRLDLLFFLVVPFLAMVHEGRLLVPWLTAAVATFVLTAALAVDPLPRSEAVLHLVLLGASAVLGRQLAAAIRRQASARTEAIRRAELEGAMLAEGHHRVKNSLQVVADLLMLARPEDDAGGEAFDQAGARIRSIAAVHAVLASRSGGRVPADELLTAVVDAAHPGGTTLDAAPVALPFQQAQHVGVVVNELVTNAHQHGTGLVRVVLTSDADGVVVRVADEGPGPAPERWAAPGLGLQLVRQVVEQGLRGTLEVEDGEVVARFRPDRDEPRTPRGGGGR
ncbi:sensor histidine kinase [Patulibacter sp.]|uniref:sensor histidine kinase n=1 Tax=Patulibacter sp. TaxID=1912859 RepID=UPI00272380BD|nr:sensor histidine kinase [Patulibacter sp.]MDO9408466.1 sensor histidine kinase [Patulibacter sp.]